MSEERTRGVIVVRRSSAPGRLSVAEVAERCGVQVGFVHRLVRLGIIDLDSERSDCVVAGSTLRVQRVVRLHEDLGVNLAGAAVILDLLDRIEALEHQLRNR